MFDAQIFSKFNEKVNLFLKNEFSKEDASASLCHIAVACSGGSDSLALVNLLYDWCDDNKSTREKIKFTVLIVDHGLRPESKDEAEQVASWMDERQIHVEILTNTDQVISSNIQAEARELRYKLMLDWCHENGVGHLWLAHHLDDQAETFLLRLARGSSPAGLASMSPQKYIGDIIVSRPLLEFSKEELQDYLKSKNLSWIEDPSNQMEKFDRVRWRNILPKLHDLGLTAHRLSKTAKIQRESQQAMDWAWQMHLCDSVTVYNAGCFKVELLSLRSLPKILMLRVLSLMIKDVSGAKYSPNYDKLDKIYALIMDKERYSFGCTCHGARFHCGNGNILWVGRDSGKGDISNIEAEYLNLSQKFEARFNISCTLAEGYFLKPLGHDGWGDWADKYDKDKKDCPFPAFIRNQIPAIWQRDGNEIVLCGPVCSLFSNDIQEVEGNLINFPIYFAFSEEFKDFTFSTQVINTM